MKATWSATRSACWRLWVTITTATLLAQPHDQLLDRRGGDRVERRARLVEQQHLGLGGERPRDAQPLLLAAGEPHRRALEILADLVVQARAAQRLVDGLLQGRCAPAPAAMRPVGALGQRVGDVVEDAHRERVGLLEDHRDLAAQLGDLELVDVLAVERDPPGARRAGGDLGEAVERAQQRGLARARRADQRQHLALAHRQASRRAPPSSRRRRATPIRCACARAPARRARARCALAWSPARPAAGRSRRRRRFRSVSARPRGGRGQPRSVGSAEAARRARGRAARRRAGRDRSPSRFPPGRTRREPAAEARHERVQREHDHEQHEGGGVCLVRGVAFAGR